MNSERALTFPRGKTLLGHLGERRQGDRAPEGRIRTAVANLQMDEAGVTTLLAIDRATLLAR